MEIVVFLDTPYRDNSFQYTLPNFATLFQSRFMFCLVTPGNATLEAHFAADAAAAGRGYRIITPDTPGEWDQLPQPSFPTGTTPQDVLAYQTELVNVEHDYFIKRLRGFRKATTTVPPRMFLIALHGAWLISHVKLSHSLLANYLISKQNKTLVLVDSVFKSAQALLMDNHDAEWFFDAMIQRQGIVQASHLDALQTTLDNIFQVNSTRPITGGPAAQTLAKANPSRMEIIPVKVQDYETPGAVLERFIDSLTQNTMGDVETTVSTNSAMPYIFIGILAVCVLIGLVVALTWKNSNAGFVKIYV